ncbi:MAG TPA: hypothetical protein VGG98_07955 [Solirubrobacteraceae bacterium]|jgi:ABC-type phosphate transport system substrate-binding protein
MGIYDRVRRSALTAICACSIVSGIGMMASPGIALAKEKCAAITGAGSSLQATQQGKWVKEGVEERKFEVCEPERPGIKYLSVGSGAGLKAVGIPGGALEKVEGKSIAYAGTDDAPTATQLGSTEAEKAGGTNLETVPTVAAPVSVIAHLPKECEPEGKEFVIPNKVLNELWLSKYANWSAFLKAAKITFKEEATKCTAAIKLEVRSDGSGTSFAFKQYLSQIEKKPWEEGVKNYVTDEAIWPEEEGKEEKNREIKHKHKAETVENKGSGGVVAAVSEELGSVGYVNLANAAEAVPAFTAYKENEKEEKFWAKIQNNGTEVTVKSAEPVKGTKEGNCPSTLTAAQEAALPKGTTNPPVWSGFHLATSKTAVTTVYPICTLTYDLGWNKYKTANLITYFGSEAAAVEAGRTVAAYFTYMVGTGAGKGQGEIASYYAPLPTKVDTVAKETVSSFVAK